MKFFVFAALFPLLAAAAFAERVTIRPKREAPADSRSETQRAAPGASDRDSRSPARIGRRRSIRSVPSVTAPSGSAPSRWYSPSYSRSSGITGSAPGRVRIVPRSGSVAPPEPTTIVHNPSVVRHINRRRRYETYPHRYYWHRVGGHRYSHYFDGDIHWYGFYSGPRFYWTRYHGDRWWWHDGAHNRWVYWSAGNWWWPAPTGVVYVVREDAYVAAPEAGVSNPPPPPEDAPQPVMDPGGSWDSPDGTRRVEVSGKRSDAFLYDVSGKNPVFLTHLGTGVEKVRFSDRDDREPARILLDFKGGGFGLFSLDGKALESSAR